MRCPGNINAVIRQFRKRRARPLTNDQIVLIAGGTDKEWSGYLKGPRVAAIVRCANLQLAKHNLQIESERMGSERWSVMSCAEAHTRHARQQASKATNHIKNAEGNMWAVVRDERASEQLRKDAAAWLELFHEHEQHKNLLIFEEWADELVKQLPQLEAVNT